MNAVLPKDFFRNLFFRTKDSLLLGAWIGGIILVGGLLWFFTQSLRDEFLKNSVNQVLAMDDGNRRLGPPLSRQKFRRGESLRGRWYSRADSEGRVMVFAVMTDGLRLPCAAMVSQDGLVEEIIPLSLQAERALKRLPSGILKTYILRIEGGAL
ncbi:hypothetical protein AGMMS49928_21150 [Spirochaetia bacterium]|nr:hypothetical protein AGMMS49928_21150 [Spirochaetia bacterium]